MNADDVRTLARRLGVSQAELARRLNVSELVVRRWCSTGPLPSGPATVALELLAASIVERPFATADGQSSNALHVHLDDLSLRAQRAGWKHPEIVAAVLSWTVNEAAGRNGDLAARAMVEAAHNVLRTPVATPRRKRSVN